MTRHDELIRPVIERGGVPRDLGDVVQRDSRELRDLHYADGYLNEHSFASNKRFGRERSGLPLARIQRRRRAAPALAGPFAIFAALWPSAAPS